MPIDGRVAALILAAGASRRMGRPKLLLPVDGEPMLRRTARRVVEGGASPIVVVVPPEDDACATLLGDLPVTMVRSASFGGPMSDSLHAGIQALPADVIAAVIILADMVSVTSEMVADVVAAARRPDAPLVVSRYGAVTAPPLAIPRRLFAEMTSITGDGVGRELVARYGASAVVRSWPVSALRDIDTEDDFAALGTR